MTRERIAFLGLFGTGNIGNEASLRAAIEAARTRMPQADLVCVCPEPPAVVAEHGIRAVSLRPEARSPRVASSARPVRLLSRVARELGRAWRSAKFLRSVDMVVVPGTGILDDFGEPPSGMPLDLFLWTALARVVGTPVHYVSVGAGPIRHPVSLRLLRLASRLATSVTYRDECSRRFMQTIGRDVTRDRVYPDLVFGRSTGMAPTERSDAGPMTVAVVVMTYLGWRNVHDTGTKIYEQYIEKVCQLIRSLALEGHRVVLLTGAPADRRAAEDVLAAVEAAPDSSLVGDTTPLVDLDDLLDRVAAADLVVATRYHNVVSALLAGRPVVSVGYAEKNADVARLFGLAELCHHVETFEPDAVLEDVHLLMDGLDRFRSSIETVLMDLRAELQSQYDRLWGPAAVQAGSAR